MRKQAFRLILVAGVLVLLVSACGGSKSPAKSTGTVPTTAKVKPAAAKPAFKAGLTATSHRPVVNDLSWAITVTVSDLSGKPIAASLHMQVLFGSLVVGQIDAVGKNGTGPGNVYHFVGRYHEKISWPLAAVGHALTLQAVVTAKGQTKKLDWPISVVKK